MQMITNIIISKQTTKTQNCRRRTREWPLTSISLPLFAVCRSNHTRPHQHTSSSGIWNTGRARYSQPSAGPLHYFTVELLTEDHPEHQQKVAWEKERGSLVRVFMYTEIGRDGVSMWFQERGSLPWWGSPYIQPLTMRQSIQFPVMKQSIQSLLMRQCSQFLEMRQSTIFYSVSCN